MNVCTIIAKNYVAYARVLARSLAATNPASRLWTLIIDDFSSHIDPAREPFEVLTPEQVGCEPFAHMALRYSVLELSTAVKPWLLRHLMAQTDGPVTYLDPDIKVYGSLQRLDDLAREHGVVLTPHNSRPIPQDDRHPSQVDVMIAGIYNLGYVSLAPREEVHRLLDWWADRLRRDCRVDPVWGYFVDQRWFDLAPGFLEDLAIVREPQYNLAYWNLHERRLEAADGGYRVDGKPLAFFHFSGFDPERPLVLSRHQDRIDVTEHPRLEELLKGYADEVLAAGYAEAHHWPYDFGALADGTRLDDRMREAFDIYATEHDDRVASPFTLEGVQAFDAWLAGPEPGAPPGISRAAAFVYRRRPDIQGIFGGLTNENRADFLEWVEGPGSADEPLLARVRGRLPTPSPEPRGAELQPEAPMAALRDAPWGMNVVGDFRADGPVGEVPRAIVAALDASDIATVPVLSRLSAPGPHGHAYGTVAPEEAPFALNLICAGPDLLPEFVKQAGADFFAGRYSIGLWFWPLEQFPAGWRARFSLLEEVWAPSAFTAAALAPEADIPVGVIPFPVQPAPVQSRSRNELGLPEGWLFVARPDYRSDAARQNAVGVVRAFRQAFADREPVALAVLCAEAGRGARDHAELLAATENDERIVIVDETSSDHGHSVIAAGDCFVSLHRATAFGLALARAMWMDRPVIATGYSGNTDFMSPDNSYLIDYQRVPIGAGHDPYPASGEWAEPDLGQAAAVMRQVFDSPDDARERGMAGGRAIRRTHSRKAAIAFMARRGAAVAATGHARRAFNPAAAQPPVLARLSRRILDGPQSAVGGRGGAARAQLRETVLRLMKPYTAHQRAVDEQIVAALGEVSQQIVQARNGTHEERAQRLAAARKLESLPAEVRALQQAIEELRRTLTG